MKHYIKLMRPHHYMKNILLFFPLMFSGRLFELEIFTKVLLGFLAFGLISSVVYIINDINDAENDARHPTKCNRPIASGKVGKGSALVFAVVIFALAITLNVFASGGNVYPWVFILSYMVLNLLYSFGCKNIPILDIAILVSGFLLRVIYGAQVANIEVSSWLYLTVMAMSFYLGLGKRRGELANSEAGEQTRKVLKFYNHAFLDKNMYMCLALAITFYSLWCVDPMTTARHAGKGFVFTVPLVILICMKYSLSIEGGSDGDPIEVIRKDKWLLILLAVYAVLAIGIIYI